MLEKQIVRHEQNLGRWSVYCQYIATFSKAIMIGSDCPTSQKKDLVYDVIFVDMSLNLALHLAI